MATNQTSSNRLGTGCLMLFTLPFAAVGVGAFIWAAWTVLAWHEIDGWAPVSAEIATTALEEHDGDDDGTSYEATATYRYTYGGQKYTSTRVAIDFGADNIGDFQQRVYAQLRAAQQSRTPVTAYVDPANPTDAVLNRELRWGMLTLKGVFALAFGGVGFGLLFGVRFAAKKLAAEAALRAQFPAEPWRWRREWTQGRIAGTARTAAYVAIGFAVLWNVISLPVLVFVPGEISTAIRSRRWRSARIEIPVRWIRAVSAKRGMQAGNKLYYDLKVEANDGTHTAASSLADYDVASWLARHWAAGGTRT